MDLHLTANWSKPPKIREIFRLNKILYVLISSELIVLSAWGLISPVFAVFLTERIVGGTLIVVGISEAIYLATKSLLQIPFGVLIDKVEGQKIDFWFLFLGNLVMAISIFFYLLSGLPWHIYLISFVYGIGNAMAYPAWAGLFTRNIIRDRESFAWSLSTTFMDLGTAGAALIGGVIAQLLGFDPLIWIVGALSLVGTFILFIFYKELIES